MDTTPTTATLNTDRLHRAIAYAIAAHFLFFVMGACAKILSENHHVAEIAFYRNALILLPFAIFIYLRGKTRLFKTQKPGMTTFRAILGAISLIVTYSALARLPMSYATVIFFTSTILTPVFSFFILKEYIGIHRWSAVLCGMIGVVIISQPSGNLDMFGLILALIAAFLHATMFITLRQLKTESPLTTTFYFIMAGAFIPALAMPWIAQTPQPSEFLLFAIVAAAGGAGQICITSAYKYAPASFITPFSYSALLWTLAADIFIWDYPIDFYAVFIGAGLIMFAQLYIIYREALHKKKRDHDA